MNTMFDFLERIQVQKEPGPEQYLGEDGLIYCGKCHTPVQCRITFEGKERIMPCICKCQKEERERQEQRMKEEEQLLYVRRLKAAGIQERHLQDWTFASATDTPSVQMAKAICGELEEGQGGKPWPFALGRCWNRKIIPGRLYC